MSKQYHIRWRKCQKYFYVTYWQNKYPWHFWLLYLYTFSLYENASLIIVFAETEYISTRSWYRNINFLRDRLLTDFVCLYNYEFWLSLCKIVRRSLILLLPLFVIDSSWKKLCITTKVNPPTTQMTLVDVGYFLIFCLLASTVFWFIWFSFFFLLWAFLDVRWWLFQKRVMYTILDIYVFI